MKTIILGGGLSALTTAYFLQQQEPDGEILLLEKRETTGGLCRSIHKGEYVYDIGPHILFSKDKEMLQLMLDVLDDGRNDLKRSNRILYKGIPVQYPFENDLSKLPAEDLNYCITAFNHNPYEDYDATNMIQFFLKTFGEGITNTYLRPYNEKIWKYDPAFMNTSMVDRIPKPTKEEIRRSAAGETVEGYLHQLYFSFPAKGGIQAVPDGFLRRLNPNICTVKTNEAVLSVRKHDSQYCITTGQGEYIADRVISTIPVQELTRCYEGVDEGIARRVDQLKYNSIIIAFAKLPYDLYGDNFAYMIPDKDVLFHRISKMDFLGEAYHHSPEEATYMIEVTFRKNDVIDTMPEDELKRKIADGLVWIQFAKASQDVSFIDISRHQYAYVIYDLRHTENMTEIRDYYSRQGIILNGRFGNFEYWNMDRILRESLNLVERLTNNKKENGK